MPVRLENKEIASVVLRDNPGLDEWNLNKAIIKIKEMLIANALIELLDAGFVKANWNRHIGDFEWSMCAGDTVRMMFSSNDSWYDKLVPEM